MKPERSTDLGPEPEYGVRPARGATRPERNDISKEFRSVNTDMEELFTASSSATTNGDWQDDEPEEKHCGRRDASARLPEFA
eukprot:528089-Heterocapsa_arctica.AAC.1